MSQTKLSVARELLAKGTFFVHLKPGAITVAVPQRLKQQPNLVLQFWPSIQDLRLTSFGVSATLHFSGNDFWCYVPWYQVYGLVDEYGRGQVWPEDAPNEAPVTKRGLTLIRGGGQRRRPPKRFHLRAVKNV